MKVITRGFTLVELLVVVSVLSILAFLSFIAYQQFSVSSNDSSRKTQVTALSKALDKYYQANGSYPYCSQLTGDPATVISTLGLTGLKPSVFKAPGDSASNSIQCGGVAATNKFVYTGDGTTECSNNTSPCRFFSLQFKEEGSGSTTTVNGQYTAPASSNSIVALSQPNQGSGCTVADFTSLTLNWSISGLTSGVTAFEIQASTENTFSTGLVSISGSTSVYVTNPAATSYTYSNNTLKPGTTYFLRVRAVSGTSPNYSAYSFWSTTKSQSPRSDRISSNITTSTTSSSSISVSWSGTHPCAVSYSLARSTSSTMSSPTVLASVTSPTSVTGLSASTLYYFALRFNTASGYSSTYMPPVSGTTSAGATPSWNTQVFATTGTFTWTNPGVSTVEVLVVAGGGAGGSGFAMSGGASPTNDYAGGGGGAGGVIYAASIAVTGNQTVVVGAAGSNSSFGSSLVVATAGGSGNVPTGNSGGSGGGGAYSYDSSASPITTVGSGGTASAGSGGTGYANAGGGASTRGYSGGGGGSSAIGGSSAGTTSGSGGAGRIFYWTNGTSGAAINTTSGTFSISVSGGGGGGSLSGGTAGTGSNGGGAGGVVVNGTAASLTAWNGTTGTGYGSGGGGGGRPSSSQAGNSTTGGAGAQGIVIVRWQI